MGSDADGMFKLIWAICKLSYYIAECVVTMLVYIITQIIVAIVNWNRERNEAKQNKMKEAEERNRQLAAKAKEQAEEPQHPEPAHLPPEQAV